MAFEREELENDDNFVIFLQELMDAGHLEGTSLGVTRATIANGVKSLTERQWNVIRNVLSEYATEKCERCALPIPWEEMYEAHDNGGYCGWCAHQRDQFDADKW